MIPKFVEDVAKNALFRSNSEVQIKCLPVAIVNGCKFYQCKTIGRWPPDGVTIAELNGAATYVNESFDSVQEFLLRSQPSLDLKDFVPFFNRYLCPCSIWVELEPRFGGWHEPRVEGDSIVLFCCDENRRCYLRIEITSDYLLREAVIASMD